MNVDEEFSIFSTILADIEDNPTILLKKKYLSDEFSVFSTILADVDEENPTILQKKKNFSDESSIFSQILTDIGEENPTILQNKKQWSAESSIFSTDFAEENPTIQQNMTGRGSMNKIDSTCTVTQTLTDSDFINLQNQELEIWKSEVENIKGGTSERLLSCNPNYTLEEKTLDEVLELFIRGDLEQEKLTKTPIDFTCTVPQTLTHSDLINTLNQELAILRSEIESINRESVCVEDRKVEEKYFADEVLEWLSIGDEISTDAAEDSVCKPKPEDGEISIDEDEELNNAGGGEIDEIIKGILKRIKRDRSYLKRVKEDYLYGDFLQEVVMNILRDKADKDEKEISSWITNGEEPEETETEVAKEDKEEKRDTKKKKKKKSPVKRTEQESNVSKRDCFGYKRRLFLIEKLRERDENLRKRRVKAVKFGIEFSFLVAEYTFLTPNVLLASKIEDYWMCLRRLGVNEDDKGTSVIIGKLKEIFEIVVREKMESKEEHSNVKNLPESIFRFEDYIFLCVNVIQLLGKIVWRLRRNYGSDDKRVKLSDLDSWFEDCGNVLMKIELKLAEMKHCVYRSVSADYESFSKSERFDSFLDVKLKNRVNACKGFGRSVVGYDLVQIWKSLFKAEALKEEQRTRDID